MARQTQVEDHGRLPASDKSRTIIEALEKLPEQWASATQTEVFLLKIDDRLS